MTIATVAGLVETLKQSRLLAPAQLDELARSLQTRFTEPRALARDLLQRGWLTPYQINQLFQERASSLVLGQYILLERLGEGGMGQVFKARHQRLERLVALKVIRKERLTHPDAIHRFQREARAAARLSHPNIVTIHDADEVGGTHFFAMEYVEGTDLAKVVKQRGTLPVAEACEYIRQAALGLQHACERGLVHRDIKPANLFLTAVGVVKILDMGLARLQEVAEELGDDTDPLTRAGVVMGTPDYIAPEQAMDVHKADIRADLYSLGCTLYYLLSGRVPFPGGTFMEKVDRHRRQEPEPLERLRPEVPAAVAAVVRKLMTKRPEDRYQTPAELAQALAPWAGSPTALPVSTGCSTLAWKPEVNLNTQGSTATVDGEAPGSSYPVATLYLPPAGSSRKRWWIVGAGGAALLALVVLFFGIGKEAGKGKTGSEWPLDDLDPNAIAAVKEFDWPPKGLVMVLGNQRGRHWGTVRSVAFSPDGKLAASAGDDHLICIWEAETLREKMLLKGHTDKVLSIAFSSDSRRLLSGSSDSTVRLWELASGEEIKKLEGHTEAVNSVTFCCNNQFALSSGGGIYNKDGSFSLGTDHVLRLWELSTGKTKVVCKGHTGPVSSVAVLPGGRRALSSSWDQTVRVWDLDRGKELYRLEGVPQIVLGLAISRDGLRAIATCHSGSAVYDVKSRKQLFALDGGNTVRSVAISLDGHRAVTCPYDKVIRLWDLDNRQELKRFEGHQGDLYSVALSPDGRRILSGGEDRTVRLWDVASGKEVLPFKGHTQRVNSAAFATDGRRVLTAGEDNTVRLWNPESGKEVRRFKGNMGVLSADGHQVLSGSWYGPFMRLRDVETRKEIRHFEGEPGYSIQCLALSRNGRYVLSGGYSQGQASLRLWDVASGKDLQRFTKEQQVIECIALSSDNRRTLYAYAHPNIHTIILRDLETGKELRRFQGDNSFRRVAFSPDDRYGLSGSKDGTVRLWDLKKDASQQPVVFVGHRSEISAVAYAPNGKLVAASALDGKVIVWEITGGKKHQQWQLPGAVHGVAFAPDSRHLAFANSNGTAYIIRLAGTPKADK